MTLDPSYLAILKGGAKDLHHFALKMFVESIKLCRRYRP